jgi:hypothetical protein
MLGAYAPSRDPELEEICHSCSCQITKRGSERRMKTFIIGNKMYKCYCQKTQLIHKLCTHVINACYAIRGFYHGRYVPRYYLKEMVLSTWNHILRATWPSGLSLKTLGKMQLTYLIQIKRCAKALDYR